MLHISGEVELMRVYSQFKQCNINIIILIPLQICSFVAQKPRDAGWTTEMSTPIKGSVVNSWPKGSLMTDDTNKLLVYWVLASEVLV